MAQYCKVGFHAGVGGNRTGIGDYMRRLDEQGIPFSVKAVDDTGLAIEAAEYKRNSGVPHNVILRYVFPGGHNDDLPNFNLPPEESAQEHWEIVRAMIPPEFEPYKNLVWLEPTNEVSTHETDVPGADWLGWFMHHISQLMVAEGYKALLSGFNAGQPEPHHWELPGMQLYLESCAQEPNRYAISLHEGKIGGNMHEPPQNFVPHIIGRFTWLFEACQRMGIGRPNVFLSEWAWTHNDMPEPDEAMEDVKWLSHYIAQYPEVRGVFLWNLGPGGGPGPLHDKLQRLIVLITEYALETEFPDPDPIPPPDPDPPIRVPAEINHTVHIVPQSTTVEELLALAMHLHPTRSAFMYSHDAVEALMFHSTPAGTIYAWDADRWDFNLEQALEWLDVNFVHRRFSEVFPGTGFAFNAWPTEHKVVTQRFGANPDYYAQFGLPGHEGVDIKAPSGSNIFAVADGYIAGVGAANGHNYGNRIYVRHINGFATVYAHLETVHVERGWSIQAGDPIGKADATGNVIAGASHLHLTLKHEDAHEGGPKYIGYPYNIVDPTPFIEPFNPTWPTPPTRMVYDLRPYLMGSTVTGYGPLYKVQTENGPQERHQTEVVGRTFYYTKGGAAEHNQPSQYEMLKDETGFIWRDVDTSPGDGEFYRLQDIEGTPWSKWCPSEMFVGQVYERNPLVTFKKKEGDCEVVRQGRQRSTIKLVAVHLTYTFFTGKTLSDVAQMHVVGEGGLDETYFFAKNYGLAGWGKPGTRSAFDGVHAPGERPHNIRENVPCL